MARRIFKPASKENIKNRAESIKTGSLSEKLLKVNLSQDRVKVLSVAGMCSTYCKENICALWMFNINDGRLIYSESAGSHFDREIFKIDYSDMPGWGRGRVSHCKGKYYILVQLADWADLPLSNKALADLYVKLQDKFSRPIFDLVDERGRTLTANTRKKGGT